MWGLMRPFAVGLFVKVSLIATSIVSVRIAGIVIEPAGIVFILLLSVLLGIVTTIVCLERSSERDG
jgi:spore maturation protein SpmA